MLKEIGQSLLFTFIYNEMILKLSNTCLTFLFSVKVVPANIIKITSVISIDT